jgi:superfamily II DNA/RNA helicase
MAALGISSTCVSADTLEEDKDLWKRVKAGEFQLVYACPEELFKARGEFMLDVARDVACPFIKNLVAVAIDECHLVHEWEDFRKEYGQLGRFRSLLPGVPFLCLSATLSRNTASYVHKTCRLADRTVMFNLPIRRDNINLVISKTSGSGIDPLLARIPQLGPDSDLSAIPKTLIFYDKIDPGIDLANTLIQQLPQTVKDVTRERDIPRDTIIRNFYGSLDKKAKCQTMADLFKGDTRIVICTDAFGLGIDIPDIEVVIQWGLDEKVSGATLYQRIGRAARDPKIEGLAIIYVQDSILAHIAKPDDWQAKFSAWPDAWKEQVVAPIANLEQQLKEQEADPCQVVPVGRERDFLRFGVPVTQETQAECMDHIHALYKEAKTLKDVFKEAKKERHGKRGNSLAMARKLDPPVLWVICTQGCRHMVFRSLFLDTDLFIPSHQYWCCDWCAYHPKEPKSTTENHTPDSSTAGISVAISMLNLNAPEPVQVEKEKQFTEQRPKKPNNHHIMLVKHRLILLRNAIWEKLPYACTMPSIVFTDKVLNKLVQQTNLRRIVDVETLEKVLTNCGMKPRMSLLWREIDVMYQIIDMTLKEDLAPLPKPVQENCKLNTINFVNYSPPEWKFCATSGSASTGTSSASANSSNTSGANTSSTSTNSPNTSSGSTVKEKRKGEQPSWKRESGNCECQRQRGATQSPAGRN